MVNVKTFLFKLLCQLLYLSSEIVQYFLQEVLYSTRFNFLGLIRRMLQRLSLTQPHCINVTFLLIGFSVMCILIGKSSYWVLFLIFQETTMSNAWYEVLSVLHLMAMLLLSQANLLLLPRISADSYQPKVSDGRHNFHFILIETQLPYH